MKIILVRPNYDTHIITPPLGLGYLSSFIKKAGFNVIVVDALREQLDEKILLQKILAENPDAVGITCLTAFYKEVVSLSKLLKDHNIKCIIGGVHPTFLPRKTLEDSGADYVICGEGEVAFLKLVRNNFVNNGIMGVYAKSDLPDETSLIVRGEIVENLDDLPFPDWEQINPNYYPKAPHGAIVKNFPIGIVMTTRGCPYECAFCASPKFYNRRIRFRSPENVIREIKYLVENFGIKEVHFEDDNLTINRRHVEKICRLIIENKINISWACPNGIRADKIDGELVELMVESGCYYFAYGVESANPEILRNIKKRETISQIKRAIAIADSKGVSCQGFFIFGLPGENKQTLEESINFSRESKLSRAQFLLLDVLPGSELWDTLKGNFKPNWNKKSFREPEWLPESLSVEELLAAQSRAFRRFYFRPRILLKLLKLINLKQIYYILKRLKDYRIIN